MTSSSGQLHRWSFFSVWYIAVQPCAAAEDSSAIVAARVIKSRCVKCHGSDKQEGDLRLDDHRPATVSVKGCHDLGVFDGVFDKVVLHFGFDGQGSHGSELRSMAAQSWRRDQCDRGPAGAKTGSAPGLGPLQYRPNARHSVLRLHQILAKRGNLCRLLSTHLCVVINRVNAVAIARTSWLQAKKALSAVYASKAFPVERRGVEPPTSALRTQRSPN